MALLQPGLVFIRRKDLGQGQVALVGDERKHAVAARVVREGGASGAPRDVKPKALAAQIASRAAGTAAVFLAEHRLGLLAHFHADPAGRPRVLHELGGIAVNKVAFGHCPEGVLAACLTSMRNRNSPLPADAIEAVALGTAPTAVWNDADLGVIASAAEKGQG